MAHPYDAFIHKVQKPGRYLGGEYHSISKPWPATRIKAALAFPDAYEIGMSHLGLRILYDHLNRDPQILAERVFAPWKDLEAELRSSGVPLVSIESARPLREFDCVGFSLQYELTYTNILNMLDLSAIPLRAEERDNRYPLIVAGGPVATQPEPLAPFIDCFVIGDGEEFFPRLLKRYVEWRAEGLDRLEILKRLAALGGIYCPQLYDVETDSLTGLQVVARPKYEGVPDRVVRQIVPDLGPYPFPAVSPVPSTETVFDRFSIEIARGCTEGCRFCQAGMIYRPVRERSPDQIIDTVLEAVKKNGYDETSLTSLSTADVSCISPLVKKLMGRLREEKVSLSVSSLRAYGLPDELLDSIADVRNTSLTFAPEAGTQRMRDVICKNITEEDMEKSAHGVFSRGWKKAKLYFMIGLPTEEDEDVRGIATTALRYLAIADRYHRGRIAHVTASVSSHVPKPHTPFQWAAMNDISEIYTKQSILQDLVRNTRVRLKWHEARLSHIEAYMTRGDRRVGDLVEYAFRQGCRFDGWDEELRFEVWMEGFKSLGIERAPYLRTLPMDARLPWDHIDVGITQDFLKKECQRAFKNRTSPPCGKPFRAKVHHTNLADALADTKPLVCFDCGIACDLKKMREERVDFLTQLGAVSVGAVRAMGQKTPAVPSVDVENAAVEEGPEDLEAIRDRNRLPRAAISNAMRVRWRLRYTKLEVHRFISHLDLIRLLARVFRRAGISVAYSLGFHPKPLLVHSPALPLGLGSAAEWVDVDLAEEIDPEVLLSRLNGAVPIGVRFEEAGRLERGDPPLSRILGCAEYEVPMPEEWDRARVAARLQAIETGEPLVVRRVRDGVTTEFDIRLGILGVAVREDEAGLARLWVRIRLGSSPLPRPGEVYQSLLGVAPRPMDVTRTGLYHLTDAGVTLAPLDLEALRALLESRLQAESGLETARFTSRTAG